MVKEDYIEVINATEHNLKNVSVKIPKNKLVVITGPSGSGKSSLAFDTIYAEGQRRYIESLSNYAKQFLNTQKKPNVEAIRGLCPAIAIDQKNTSNNPRSNVATVTEIYDFLRVIFARIGVPHSPITNLPLKKQTSSEIIQAILSFPKETKLRICAPFVYKQKGQHIREIQRIMKIGYEKIKINGTLHSLEDGTIPNLDKNKEHTLEVIIDRVIIKDEIKDRVANAVETCLKLSKKFVNLDIVELPVNEDFVLLSNGMKVKAKTSIQLSTHIHCPDSGITIEQTEPKMFSFNSPYGMCQKCQGLGTEKYFSEGFIVPNDALSLREGAIKPWENYNMRYYSRVLEALSEKYNFSLDVPYNKLSQEVREVLMHGTDEQIEIVVDNGLVREKNKISFKGVVNELDIKISESDEYFSSENCEEYQTEIACRACNGHRLNPVSLLVKINDLNIGEVCQMSVSKAIKWFQELPQYLSQSAQEISRMSIKEISDRLSFLDAVGLGYLQLNRSAQTLSGGESQRIRLASQIGSSLSGILYVLDEPSIGLHQSDNRKLISTLKKLRDIGNSVFVIEHDEETMREADYVIDCGPGAGKYGGEIVSQGTVEYVMKDPKSITGKFLGGYDEIKMPKETRQPITDMCIEIIGARENNLKNLDIKFPLGLFTVVCGVSGGGKSTIVNDILHKAASKKLHKAHSNPGLHTSIRGFEYIDKVIAIDQAPIGKTPRSNPATYIGLFNLIRDIFANLPEAKARGYEVGRFSFNVKGGRCENCQGDGVMKIEMQFLPDVYIPCDVCDGKRYNAETLEIKYKGYTISDVLDMSVREAMTLFENIPHIQEKLICLANVGLDYIKLGQPSNQLSGGEAQRIKLAKELSRKATGNTLYILDEPTTGLHMVDIKKLLNVLHTLVDSGNTVIVIEHNLDVIKTADYVLDIGPVGGDEGGQIVASGTPIEIANNPKSVTGPYLKEVLDGKK